MAHSRPYRLPALLVAGAAASALMAAPALATEGPAAPPPGPQLPSGVAPPTLTPFPSMTAPSLKSRAPRVLRNARLVHRRVKQGRHGRLRVSLNSPSRLRIVLQARRERSPDARDQRPGPREHRRAAAAGPPPRTRPPRRPLPRHAWWRSTPTASLRARSSARWSCAASSSLVAAGGAAAGRHGALPMRQLALHLMTGSATLAAPRAARGARQAGARASGWRSAGGSRGVRSSAVRSRRRIRGACSASTSTRGTSTTGRARSAPPPRRSRSSRRSRAAARSPATRRRAVRKGIRRLMVSWEPWRPVPSALGVAAQARPQRGYRNIDIARGAQDRYILRFAERARALSRASSISATRTR